MFSRLTPIAKRILIINSALYIIESFFNIHLSEWFGLRVIFSEDFAIYQFATYMWLHDSSSIFHLLGNMIAVLVFAPLLEMVWGSKRFLIFYLVCGIGAGMLYGAVDYIEKLPLKKDAETYLENPTPEKFEFFIHKYKSFGLNIAQLGELADNYYEDPRYKAETIQSINEIYYWFITKGNMIGASGAVFGILFAFAFLFPNTELFLLFPPIPIKAKYLVFFYAVYEIYAEFTRTPGDNVAHLAHLGGMLIAFILLKLWKRNNQKLY